MSNSVTILSTGYSRVLQNNFQPLPCILKSENQLTYAKANGTCTLVRSSSGQNVLVDTLGPWDSEKLLNLLKQQGLHADDIHYVVGTHLHTDHIGNLNLFPKARMQFVGDQICTAEDNFYLNVFAQNEDVINLCPNVNIILTPGHTSNDISVIVENVPEKGKMAIVGDLFENEYDHLDGNEHIWLEAGSQYPELQRQSRERMLHIIRPDWIVPGHGEPFRV